MNHSIPVLVVAAGMAFGASAQTPRTSVRVFYIGNSLTMNTMPAWHGELGRSAGKEWVTEAIAGPGAPIWSLREGLLTRNAAGREKLLNQPWDAITLQPFGPFGLERRKDDRDIGDIHNASEMIRMFLKAHPRGRVLIYAVWPSLEPDKKRKGQEAREYPDHSLFDYERSWLRQYETRVSPGGELLPVEQSHRTRDYHNTLFGALCGRFRSLWEQGRLTMIPSGDVFLELHRRLQRENISGLRDIRDYYTDIQHLRAGLPRYTAAAIFYACLFGEHPGKLNWKLYNDRSRYGDDPYHDIGELLPITEENARLVNEVIWETVRRHPFAGIAPPCRQ